jgi:hypothetical protein
VGVRPNLSLYKSKIKGSFIVLKNTLVIIPDINVSCVNRYSVLITCFSQKVIITGYNIDLFKQVTCEDQIDGPVCLNSAMNLVDRPSLCFFTPYTGAAYIFSHNNKVNISNLGSILIFCCISTLYKALSRQLQNNTINFISCLSQMIRHTGMS